MSAPGQPQNIYIQSQPAPLQSQQSIAQIIQQMMAHNSVQAPTMQPLEPPPDDDTAPQGHGTFIKSLVQKMLGLTPTPNTNNLGASAANAAAQKMDPQSQPQGLIAKLFGNGNPNAIGYAPPQPAQSPQSGSTPGNAAGLLAQLGITP